MNKKTIGNFGEKVAERYLRDRGYNILESNWRAGHKEIDLIAYKKRLIAVEVKTRSESWSKVFAPTLRADQVERIRRAIKKYCLLHNFNYQTSRLDLIIVSKVNNNIFIKHHLDI